MSHICRPVGLLLRSQGTEHPNEGTTESLADPITLRLIRGSSALVNIRNAAEVSDNLAFKVTPLV